MMVAPPRVLLISESRITRRVVEMTFADQHVELVTAASGHDGLAAWQEKAAAVVLADLAMTAPPAGLELARLVQAQAGGRPVSVILLAGQLEVVDDADVAAAGACAVLRKPLDSLQLIEAVRGAVRAGRQAQAPWPAQAEAADDPEHQAAADDPEHRTAADDTEDQTAVALRDEDLERVAARVAAIWGGDADRERRVTDLLAARAEQAATATASAAAERVAPAATSEAAERLVRELAPALVAEVARLVVADVSERLVREEIARMRSAPALQ